MFIGNTCYPDNIYPSTMFWHACLTLLWTIKKIWNPTCFNKNIIKLKWFNNNIIKPNVIFVKLWPKLVSASWIYISHFLFFFIWHTINLTSFNWSTVYNVYNIYLWWLIQKYIHLNISLLIFLQATEYWLKPLVTVQSPWANTCTLSVPIFIWPMHAALRSTLFVSAA